MALPSIPTLAEIQAMPDSEYVARCATGPVIQPSEVAEALESGSRVYALPDRNSGIVRIVAPVDLDSYLGMWVGASTIPVGRA